MRVFALLTLSSLMAASPASADPAPKSPFITMTIERHFTTNALDSSTAVADWYSLLRGSLQREFQTLGGTLKLGAEFQATRYDQVDIEDDRALALAAEFHKKISPRIELRGGLTYRVSSDGDDLTFYIPSDDGTPPIGPIHVGTRATKQVFGGKVELGIDLGKGYALIVDLGNQAERTGRTHFQRNFLPSERLDPDRDRLQFSAKLLRTEGTTSYGVSASIAHVAVEELGTPLVGLSLDEYTLRLEATTKSADGAAFGLAFGAQMLRGAQGIYSDVRPTYQVSFARPFWKKFEIRGNVFGRFESVDSDDPLASWLNRAELEAACKVNEKLQLGIGVFAEIKRNLLLENWERKRGFYAEANYEIIKPLSVVFRMDLTDHYASVIEEKKRTADFFVGLRTKI